MKLNKGKQGISLIVLVITIIVMIIIAATIILTLDGNNIIGRASEARTESDEAALKEAASVFLGEYNLKVFKKKIDPNEVTAEEYIKEQLAEEGFPEKQLEQLMVFDDGTIVVGTYIYTDKNGDKAPIPLGFSVSKATGENTVDNGLVIYEGKVDVTDNNLDTSKDTINQFVWVPVEDISEFVRRDGWYDGAMQILVSNNRVVEPFNVTMKNGITLSASNDLTGEFAEYAAMYESVKEHGGFYIARYESGTSQGRKNSSGGSGTTDVLVQRNKVVYNYVAWGQSMTDIDGEVVDSNGINYGKGAVQLSREFYKNSKSVVSTLCYGIQWDAVMNFMKNVENPNVEGKKYIEDSTGMGKYGNNVSGASGPTTTGAIAEYSVKNICDMAGNATEWTMEGYKKWTGSCIRIHRGGNPNGSGASAPVSSRMHDWGSSSPENVSNKSSFRITLYLK